MSTEAIIAIVGGLQTIALGVFAFFQKKHRDDNRVRASSEKRLWDIFEKTTDTLVAIKESMTRQQERFDDHDRNTIHNLQNLRQGLAAVCPLDPTQAKETHEAAQRILRTGSAQ